MGAQRERTASTSKAGSFVALFGSQVLPTAAAAVAQAARSASVALMTTPWLVEKTRRGAPGARRGGGGADEFASVARRASTSDDRSAPLGAGRTSNASTQAGQRVGVMVSGSTPRARLASSGPPNISQTSELGPPLVPKAAPIKMERLSGIELALPPTFGWHSTTSAATLPGDENAARTKRDGGGPESAMPMEVVEQRARTVICPATGQRLIATAMLTGAVESERASSSKVATAVDTEAGPSELGPAAEAAAPADRIRATGRRDGLGV